MLVDAFHWVAMTLIKVIADLVWSSCYRFTLRCWSVRVWLLLILILNWMLETARPLQITPAVCSKLTRLWILFRKLRSAVLGWLLVGHVRLLTWLNVILLTLETIVWLCYVHKSTVRSLAPSWLVIMPAKSWRRRSAASATPTSLSAAKTI
jgi:hypothetical protein